MLRPLATALLAASVASCMPAPGTERVSAGESVDIASAGAQLSFQRAQNGVVRYLVYSRELQAAAEDHAEYLSASEDHAGSLSGAGNLGHNGAGGSTVSDRVRRAGFRSCLTAENVARGLPDVRSVVAAWMDSPRHRANILNPQATHYGMAQAGSVWVLVLARPC